MILDERGFSSFEDWADRASFLLDRYGNPPTIISVTQWPVWAEAVCQMPQIAAQSPPSPQFHSTWRSWAQDFNRAVELV